MHELLAPLSAISYGHVLVLKSDIYIFWMKVMMSTAACEGG